MPMITAIIMGYSSPPMLMTQKISTPRMNASDSCPLTKLEKVEKVSLP